jgi:hypothetical protein
VTGLHASDTAVPATARAAALDRDSLAGVPVCALAADWRGTRRRCVPLLDAHHRMLKGAGGTSSPYRDWLPRLVTVCRDHHDWAHDQARAVAEALGIIVRRGDGDLARLTTTPVRYALSGTGWAFLTPAGLAVDCPPPDYVPEGFAE